MEDVTMRILAVVLLSVCTTLCAQNATTNMSAQGCLIVKHKGTLGRRLMFTALVGIPIAPGSKYDLVDAINVRISGVAFKGKELERIQADGVRVVILENKYTPVDLDHARISCGQGSAPK
jgi:hypothetical protein